MASNLWTRSMGIRFGPAPSHPGSEKKPLPYSPVPLEPPPSSQQPRSISPPPQPSPQPSAASPASSVPTAPLPASPSLMQWAMSPETLARAKASPRGSPGSFWSHTMYRDAGKPVAVHYCTTREDMEAVCARYFADEPILGFDLEWSPRATKNAGPRHNVSLIQVASPSRIGLFHYAVFPAGGAAGDDLGSPTFRRIMDDPGVSKVGVAIKADCTRMEKYLGVPTRGILELSHLYKMVRYQREGRPSLINKSLVTLATQVEECLGLPMYKGESVRSSDWTRRLNARQVSYSASDAYAGLQLFRALDEQRRALDPCPPLPFHAELGLPLPIPDLPDTNHSPPSPDPPVSKRATPTRGKTPAGAPQFRDDRIAKAHERMQRYRSSKRGAVSTGPSALRTYYVWHDNADLDPPAVARLLRDPPLQTHTVVSYVLGAILDEGLGYDPRRVRGELLATLKPEVFKMARYQALREACEQA